MRRREFITLLSGAVLGPAGARAQQVPRIGYLSAGTPNSDYMRRTLAALEQGLTENGMTAGRDYVLETRFAEGDYDRFPQLARELQQAHVSIIIPSTIAAVRAAQQLSPPVPVVMPAINDPVGTGLVASLAHPGGHTTGVATLIEDVTPKLLEFLGVLVPRATMLAAIYNPANPSNLAFLQRLRSESGAHGISLSEFALRLLLIWRPYLRRSRRNAPMRYRSLLTVSLGISPTALPRSRSRNECRVLRRRPILSMRAPSWGMALQ